MEFEILYWIQQLRTPALDEIMTAVTFLGDGGWFWIALGTALFAVPRTRRTGAAMLISLAAGFILGNVILKNVVARQRPCWLDPMVALLIENPSDYSFPSGHSLASFEGAVSILLYHKKWGVAAVVLAALIACSRLYLFVHFPTDVLAGSLLGILIAVIVHRWMETPERKWNRKEAG
ncbi:MAG: phosphatase PAP2 family protein [Lachnospiraceae bacterium]|jgi:undecaprenyl-diphosphatase